MDTCNSEHEQEHAHGHGHINVRAHETKEIICFKDNDITKIADVYYFNTPYIITISGCLIVSVTDHIYIDITDTDSQNTLEEFVTDIAQACGLDILVTIPSLLLPIPADLDVALTKNSSVDITVELKTFKVIDNAIKLELHILGSPSKSLEQEATLYDILKETSVHIIDATTIETGLNDICTEEFTVCYNLKN